MRVEEGDRLLWTTLPLARLQAPAPVRLLVVHLQACLSPMYHLPLLAQWTWMMMMHLHIGGSMTNLMGVLKPVSPTAVMSYKMR